MCNLTRIKTKDMRENEKSHDRDAENQKTQIWSVQQTGLIGSQNIHSN